MKEKALQLVKGTKSVTEFLSDAVDAFKDVSFLKALESALPWAQTIGEATAEALPPLKLITHLVDELTKETDPEKLGLTACTIAYQRAVELAFKTVGAPTGERHAIQEAKEQLRELSRLEELDMGTFLLTEPEQHEFFTQATLNLQVVAIKVGYTGEQVDEVTRQVQENFRHSLTLLLTDGGTREKFAPFTDYLKLGGADEKRARKLLAQHANYQRWLYEEAPVLRVSPFALKHVYIETDCGKLDWQQINQPQRHGENRLNPFKEEHGGRQPLLETVLDLLGSDTLSEAIIIQGIAGAGKSSFTLRLCDELLKRKLHPIRIRIKDLSFDQHIKDALPKAVLFSEPDYAEPEPPTFDNLFLNDSIFKEHGVGRYEKICKYVLILDGWDEISLSDVGFKTKVAQMLNQLNDQYLKQRNPRVRVILTGRPSSDIGDTNALREKTPVLTVRKLTPQQLRDYVARLAAAVNATEPLIEKTELTADWTAPEPSRFEPLFKKYKAAFEKEKQQASGELDVLGLPLLTYLTVRLVAEWQGELSPLLENTTTLYRHLVDLTCEEAAKVERSGDQHKVYGDELRQLLRETAAAITISGEENISRKTLASRLDKDEDEMDQQVSKLDAESKLSALLISFYFKGGHSHLGCEFAHKSFREYLFAEEIVETLKTFGRLQEKHFAPRDTYWEDFLENKESDKRFKLSRAISELLAPQWLTPEVKNHLKQLLAWEIERAITPAKQNRPGKPTEALSWEEWKRVRTALADLWEWWGEGAHLRPQAYKVRGERKVRLAYVNELIEWDAPRDADGASWGYARTTTMDAHLGEGLFHLCALVHSYMAENEQETELTTQRKYQVISERAGKHLLLFKPSGEHPDYFRNYIARINSAGWQTHSFPFNTYNHHIDLSGADLSGADLSAADLSGAHLFDADLRNADLSHVDLSAAYLSGADLFGADLRGAHLNGADLRGADLRGAHLSGAHLSGAHFTFDSLTKNSQIVRQFEKAAFDFIFFDGERLDREEALRCLRELIASAPMSSQEPEA